MILTTETHSIKQVEVEVKVETEKSLSLPAPLPHFFLCVSVPLWLFL